MGAPPTASCAGAAHRWRRERWDAPDVLRFYAGSPFSNFAASPIWLPCPHHRDLLVEHPTVEHAFQAAKTTSWPDFQRVWLAATPAEAKRIGRWEITPRGDWANHRFQAMLIALRAKYEIPRFRDALLATGERPLAEDSPSDFEWGARDAHGGYRGHNYLGRALMRVRDELRQRPTEAAGAPNGRVLRHPTLSARAPAHPDLAARSDLERNVLGRCLNSSIPWTPTGRDAEGRLVLTADIPAGARRPGRMKRATLTIDAAGLIHRDHGLLPPADPADEPGA